MAEAHISTFFGAAGLFGQLCQVCFNSFEFWGKVGIADEKAYEFHSRLEFQRAKLHYWTTKWKTFEIEAPSEIADTRLQTYQHAIGNYLQLISHTIQNLVSHQDDVPILQNMLLAKASSIPQRLSRLLDPQSFDSTDHLRGDPSSLKERLQWALQSGKAIERIELLTTLIHDLESFLPPPGYDSNVTGAIFLNSALTWEQDKSKLKWLRWLGQQRDFDSFTTSLARLKATNLTHVNELDLYTELKTPKLNGVVQRMRISETSRHYFGTYDGQCVLIERKTIPSGKNNHTIIDDRIQKIVCLLKLSQGVKGLGTPPCLGYIKGEPELDPEGQNCCVYEILYSANPGQVFSLRNMLRSENFPRFKSALSLDKRFKVARTLAKAIYCLHSAEWLHKGIRSSNIVFLPPAQTDTGTTQADVQFNHAYLVGFECSRPNSQDEGTENIAGTEDSNLYRHPAAQGLPKADPDSYLGDTGRFSKNHDIYSLGVILIELGLLMSAGRIKAQARKYDPDYGKHSAEKFQRLLMDKLVPEVALTMGKVYADVTFCCLKADFYQPSPELHHMNAETFYQNVVAALDLCRA
ncbi:hypothetical protein ZTR_10824 [Talaromyces verruculosus]|nr:hypothetical protein ZTR_10824 [Talaromyces verruculosus]